MNRTNIIIKQRDYYSSHIDEFVEKYLNIKLTEWQKTLINILNKQITHRRGRIQNKEYIRNVWIFSKCLLESDTHILITSCNSNLINGLFNLINELPKDIQNEICIVHSKEPTYIKFNNNSTIKFYKFNKKQNAIITEEFRRIKSNKKYGNS